MYISNHNMIGQCNESTVDPGWPIHIELQLTKDGPWGYIYDYGKTFKNSDEFSIGRHAIAGVN